MIDKILQRVDANESEAVERLMDFLRIPSVSADSAFAKHCQTAADWTAEQLKAAGLQVEVRPTGKHPVVVGKSHAAGPSAPTILFYGHYDVQPPDPLGKWHSPPFEPVIRDNRIYARGASDDKGQVMCFIEAMRAWHEVGEPLPVNVIVLIEGEEECGSVHFEPFVNEHASEFAADVAVVSDTAFWAPGKPAVTYGLRGLLYMEVILHGPGRDLHSGVYGGSIANPATELTLVLGKLFDENHHVTIPGFYDDVPEPAAEETKRWEALGFSDSEWANSIGMNAVHGEAGYNTLQRRWVRPSCDINGIYGGYMGEGAKTVIATHAGAKVSFRLAPNQDAAKIEAAFREWIDEQTPPGCRWEILSHGGANPVMIPTDSPWLVGAQRAIRQGCGIDAVMVRDGASIPVVATFKKALGLDTMLIGFGLHDDNLHSPNEKFELANFRMGRRTHAALLYELAQR